MSATDIMLEPLEFRNLTVRNRLFRGPLIYELSTDVEGERASH